MTASSLLAGSPWSLVDWSPVGRLLLLAAVLAGLLLGLVWLRRHRPGGVRAGLLALTLFLTFDLIVFGAFTRLSDSGLGCPDWPGCYGEASPWAARADIGAAQTAQPSGPVTWGKAWIEMIHRYLAMTVGALIVALTALAWWRRSPDAPSPWWPTATLAWVLVQGLFGKFTVTLKLYPAIVTLHLLGGLGLLALLVAQHARGFVPQHAPWSPVLRRGLGWLLLILLLQVALGGWVSTNYAVLACRGFPTCNGQWWPEMNVSQGFTVLRHLGRDADGGFLSVEALVAIHWVHRGFALLVLSVAAWVLAGLWRSGPPGRRAAGMLGGLLLLQVGTGMANVVLNWPLVAALLHTAGAAGLVGWLVWLHQSRPVFRPEAWRAAATPPAPSVGRATVARGLNR